MDESLVTTDLSLMGLFSEADLVVKLVMLGLMIASVISWAIIFEKLILIKLVNRNAIKFYRDFGAVISMISMPLSEFKK
ncbi:MAG: hypothetical protein CM15mP73_5440 [Hyphomicrobiales bacterium]|nr:MAG: hypothetical protein CM15mP73_5440 [Hyphomicrobiales bacterium]